MSRVRVEVRDLSKTFAAAGRVVPAVDSVSFDVQDKEFVALIFVTHDLAEAITLSDRVIVMTSRPGRVKLIHEVKLPRPRDVIRIRETDAYAREFSTLWHVLGEEFAKATEIG